MDKQVTQESGRLRSQPEPPTCEIRPGRLGQRVSKALSESRGRNHNLVGEVRDGPVGAGASNRSYHAVVQKAPIGTRASLALLVVTRFQKTLQISRPASFTLNAESRRS